MSKDFIPYCVAMVTPFDEEGDFSPDAVVAPLVAYMVGVAPGLLVCGSTGEQHCLSIAERTELYQKTRLAAGPDFPIYVGVSAFKTKDAVVLAQGALAAAATGIMLGFPPYRIPSQAMAEQYVRAVASATPLPIFLYNNPRRTGFDLAPDTAARLVRDLPTVLGLKEAGPPENVKAVQALLADQPGAIAFFSGSDARCVGGATY